MGSHGMVFQCRGFVPLRPCKSPRHKTRAVAIRSFSRFLRVAFQGSRVTSDGGLILARELDEQFGLSELIGDHLVDSRRGRNTQFPLADLLRQSVYSRLAGYEDLNDAARLSADPTFRLIRSDKVGSHGMVFPCRGFVPLRPCESPRHKPRAVATR